MDLALSLVLASSPFFFVGYFVLDGFDFGVGMSLPFLGRDDIDRRVLINTIGPVWDLNETWVIVAGAALFAAFPEWYATLFSGFYLALLLILLALIVRGVSFEYRHQRDRTRAGSGVRQDDRRRLGGARAALGRRVRQHRAGRPARRAPRLHRHALRPAQPVRAARRADDAAAVLHARRRASSSLKTDGDIRRAGAAPGRASGAVTIVGRGRIPGLDGVIAALLGRVRWCSPSLAAVAAGRLGWLANLRGAEGWAFGFMAATIALAVLVAVRRAVPERDAVVDRTRRTA